MKSSILVPTLITALVLSTGSLYAADSAAKDKVAAATKALGGETNYSWKTVVVVPPDARFRPGPTEGKTEKDGFTVVTMTFFDNPVQIVRKGAKGVYLDQDGNWVTAKEAENQEGPGRFMAWVLRNLQTPAVQAAELVSACVEVKKDDDTYSSDLTEGGAKTLLSFQRDANDSNVSNAKGSVKFWIKDGMLSKYEFKVKGTVDWNGNSIDVDRTTTVEVKDVNATGVTVPEGAKKKLS